METTNAQTPTDALPWTMRLGGVLVILLSTFLLVQDVGFGVGDDILCAVGLGLGAVAFVASWLPGR